MHQSSEHSFIHNLQIAAPCKADWDAMSGDERKRFCSMCKLNVYNISAMTLPEAEKLIIESEGRVCLRMFRRSDGTVITQDCPVGLATRFKRRLQRTFAIATAACAVIVAWAANVRLGNQPSLREKLTGTVSAQKPPQCIQATPAMMGEIAIPQHQMGKVAPAHVVQGRAARPHTAPTSAITNVEFIEPEVK